MWRSYLHMCSKCVHLYLLEHFPSFLSQNMYSLASESVWNFQNNILQEDLLLTPTIILIIFFWMLSTLVLIIGLCILLHVYQLNIVAYGGVPVFNWYTRNRMHNPFIKITLFLSVEFLQKPIWQYRVEVSKYTCFKVSVVLSGVSILIMKHAEYKSLMHPPKDRNRFSFWNIFFIILDDGESPKTQ
jgi:hypothetical protein